MLNLGIQMAQHMSQSPFFRKSLTNIFQHGFADDFVNRRDPVKD